MDPAHIIVGALTLFTAALLVWIELRSRRKLAAEANENAPANAAGAQRKDSV
jgi:hypothetical protein